MHYHVPVMNICNCKHFFSRCLRSTSYNLMNVMLGIIILIEILNVKLQMNILYRKCLHGNDSF